jgi:2-polyprenyl-3-methyl-5-hydroxy-6-metoxy-1,4-benzoquinol methylase
MLALGHTRVFDLGCGNGATANELSQRGFHLTGVDPSKSGIKHANASFPHLSLHVGSGYDDLRQRFGTFPIVISLEVVEHLYSPRVYARRVHDLLDEGGIAVISTPYHGYLKNLALAVTGRMDAHFTTLWDHGHIKFWSINTLRTILEEAGLVVTEIRRVGRIPWLAKSMIIVAEKRSARQYD